MKSLLLLLVAVRCVWIHRMSALAESDAGGQVMAFCDRRGFVLHGHLGGHVQVKVIPSLLRPQDVRPLPRRHTGQDADRQGRCPWSHRHSWTAIHLSAGRPPLVHHPRPRCFLQIGRETLSPSGELETDLAGPYLCTHPCRTGMPPKKLCRLRYHLLRTGCGCCGRHR